MTNNHRKYMNEKIANGESVTMQDALDCFFNRDDQDAFAKSLGWEDKAQMLYYEDMAEREEQNQLPPPPAEIYIHELDKVDAREVYEDTDWSGVY
jgi:hypothetical protein